MKYVYVGRFAVCLVIVVVICRLVLCFCCSREELAVVSRADVTGRHLLEQLQYGAESPHDIRMEVLWFLVGIYKP